MKKALGRQRGSASETLDVFTPGAKKLLDEQGVSSSVLNIENAIQLQEQRNRYEASASPLTVIRRRDSEDDNTAIFLGSAQDLFDEMKNVSKVRGFNWEIECLILLSKQKRNRVVQVSLHSPAKSAMDWDAKTRADHLLNKDQAVSELYSKVVGKWYRLFEERSRIVSGDIPEKRASENMTIDGFLRFLKSIKGRSTPEGTVNGDPYIRITLDGEQGIVTRMSGLDDPDHVEVITSWLHNVVKFTHQNRDLYFDARTRTYMRKKPGHRPPPSSSFEDVLRELGDA